MRRPSCLSVFSLKYSLFVVAGSSQNKAELYLEPRPCCPLIILDTAAWRCYRNYTHSMFDKMLMYTSSKKTWRSTREVWVVRNPHTLCRPECNCKDLKWHLFWPGPLESSLCSPECSLHHRLYHCWLLAPWGLKRVQHLFGMPFRQTSEGLNIEEHVPRQCSSMLTWSRKKMHGGIGCLHGTARFLGTKRISRS